MKIRTFALALTVTSAWCSSGFSDDWLGWHAANYYGTFDNRREDVWKDMTEDVYCDGVLDDLYHDPCDLFHLGQGFWNCQGCYYAPLHYEQVRPTVLTPNAPYAGASWYRGIPVGKRERTPLAEGTGEYDKSDVVP